MRVCLLEQFTSVWAQIWAILCHPPPFSRSPGSCTQRLHQACNSNCVAAAATMSSQQAEAMALAKDLQVSAPPNQPARCWASYQPAPTVARLGRTRRPLQSSRMARALRTASQRKRKQSRCAVAAARAQMHACSIMQSTDCALSMHHQKQQCAASSTQPAPSKHVQHQLNAHSRAECSWAQQQLLALKQSMHVQEGGAEGDGKPKKDKKAEKAERVCLQCPKHAAMSLLSDSLHAPPLCTALRFVR